MKRKIAIPAFLVLVIALMTVAEADQHEKADASPPDWSFNATLIISTGVF